jgi:hypothetical protein
MPLARRTAVVLGTPLRSSQDTAGTSKKDRVRAKDSGISKTFANIRSRATPRTTTTDAAAEDWTCLERDIAPLEAGSDVCGKHTGHSGDGHEALL